MQRLWKLRGWILTVSLFGVLGCAGIFGGAGGPAKRSANTEIVLVSFGSVNGEILECG